MQHDEHCGSLQMRRCALDVIESSIAPSIAHINVVPVLANLLVVVQPIQDVDNKVAGRYRRRVAVESDQHLHTTPPSMFVSHVQAEQACTLADPRLLAVMQRSHVRHPRVKGPDVCACF